MRRVCYLLFVSFVLISSCKKNSPTDEEDRKTELPNPVIGNNKIIVTESTVGYPAAQLESTLGYILASKQGEVVTLIVVSSQTNGTPITLFFGKGLPTTTTTYDLKHASGLGTDGTGFIISYGGVTYSSSDGHKLYARKNSSGTFTIYFNKLNMIGTLSRTKEVSAQFTIPATMVIDGNSTKNMLVD